MRIVLLLIALSTLIACSAANSEKGNKNDGPAETRSFNVSGFDGVSLAASDNVRIVKGAAFSVAATGPSEILDCLEIEVRKGRLNIGRKPGGWMGWARSGRSAEITVTLPELRKAAVAGSGDMRVDTTAEDVFVASLAGSGDLEVMRVAAKSVKANLAGSGDISLAGVAERVALSVAGSGDIDASGLTAETADTSIAGSGDIRVRATQSAAASIVGSGDIEIIGTKNCTVSKHGSGEVRCSA